MRLSSRSASYVAAVGVVVLVRVLADASTWHSNAELHTVLEATSALLAVIVGVLAMMRFAARRTTPLLYAGVAFCGAALLDVLHTALTSTSMLDVTASLPPDIMPWSWFFSRFFLAALLAARAWTWRGSGRPSTSRVVVGASLLLLDCVLIPLWVPLPAPISGLVLARPQELLTAVLLVYALVSHLRLGAWRDDPFESALIVSMIMTLAGQTLFMPFSAVHYDAMFDVAHVLKVASNLVGLIGLFAGTLHLFRVAEHESQQRTFGFLERLPVGVFVLDADGHPHYANQQAQRYLGTDIDARLDHHDLARRYQTFVIGTDVEYPTERMPVVRALHGEHTTVSDMEIRHHGEAVPLQVSGAPLFDREGKVAFAIAAFQDIRELRRTALEDPLTGLANRLAFHEEYGRMTGLCWRMKQPVCVAVIDIDRFKSVNDTYGHDMGDAVLRRVARIIAGSVRATDFVARWGGEEIVVLLPGVPATGAVIAIERALTSLRKEVFESEGRSFSVTFSAGVAEIGRQTAAEAAVAHADRPLYAAKQAGRDRVVAAATSVTQRREAQESSSGT